MSASTTETVLPADLIEADSTLTRQLSSLLTLQESLSKEVEDRFHEILKRLEAIEQQITREIPVPSEAEVVPSLDWEAKKQAIYQEHGMTADRTVENGTEPTSVYGVAEEDPPKSRVGQPGFSTDFDSMAIPDEDRQEVERLKAELHEKLRAAEVELSISRAKIVQETAQLEEKRHELEKLAAQIEPSAMSPAEGKKTSMLDRLSRHMLPARKPS
ncbi:MAG: hypothetical protein MK108_04065 [Mariniblastus sp.]|nr:hypothetical protein [Mariniblastus sp.]